MGLSLSVKTMTTAGGQSISRIGLRIEVECQLGDKAMVQWQIETILPTGDAITVKGVNYFEIENDKIKYFSNYHDTAPFAPLFANQG